MGELVCRTVTEGPVERLLRNLPAIPGEELCRTLLRLLADVLGVCGPVGMVKCLRELSRV